MLLEVRRCAGPEHPDFEHRCPDAHQILVALVSRPSLSSRWVVVVKEFPSARGYGVVNAGDDAIVIYDAGRLVAEVSSVVKGCASDHSGQVEVDLVVGGFVGNSHAAPCLATILVCPDMSAPNSDRPWPPVQRRIGTVGASSLVVEIHHSA